MILPTACSLFLGIPFFTRSLKGNGHCFDRFRKCLIFFAKFGSTPGSWLKETLRAFQGTERAEAKRGVCYE
jgi:hypothetical protein